MPRVLVVANETIGGASLVEAVEARIADDPTTQFRVIVPMTRPKSGLVIYDAVERDAAQVRVDLATAFLRQRGVEVEGEVGDPDPFRATMDALNAGDVDEVILSTYPETRSGWLRRDLVQRVRDATDLPVQHVVSDMEAESSPFRVTVVVANRTAVSDALLSRLKEKAESNPGQLFIVVVPQEGRDGRGPAIARARLGNALDRLRGEGLTAAGMIGDPDPYVATMNALQFYRVDEVIISTLPETRSGWLRADLVNRVRRASDVEVEHIVTERETSATG
jgi:hypothetical protein